MKFWLKWPTRPPPRPSRQENGVAPVPSCLLVWLSYLIRLPNSKWICSQAVERVLCDILDFVSLWSEACGLQTGTPAARHIVTCTVIAQCRRHVRLAHEGSSLSCVPKTGHSSTRHVSLCASQYAEHQHKFSLTYLFCVTVVLFSEPRLVVHASIYPL